MVGVGESTGSSSTERRPLGIAVAVLIIIALGTLTGCGVALAQHASGSVAPAISAANRQASAVCARTDPGSDFSIAVFAKVAASALRQAHVTPNPWAKTSPDTVIFACFVTRDSRLAEGVFVDPSGGSTPVPVGTYNACLPPGPAATAVTPAAICSFRLVGSPSRSINPAIAAVLVVTVIAAIWYVTRRRRRQAAL
jgi:hypothetical protein